MEWVWLAEATEPFTKIPDMLKYRAVVSRGRLKLPPDKESCRRQQEVSAMLTRHCSRDQAWKSS